MRLPCKYLYLIQGTMYFSGMYSSNNNSIVLSVLNKLFNFDSVDVPTFLMAFALVGKTSGTVNSPMRL